MNKKTRDRVYLIGVIITLLSLAGLAESYTGHGSTFCSLVWFVVGFSMVLAGYIK